MNKSLVEQVFEFTPFTIGLENIMQRISSIEASHRNQSYPPHNIRKIGDNQYVIELAVAGFKPNEIDISIDDGVLKVIGKIVDENKTNYLYKGIAQRAFTRTFTLADSVIINDAKLENGMLQVILENVIPEHKKPRKINIKTTGVQLLTE